MATNLVDFLRSLFADPAEAAKFQANPEQYMADHGVADASYEEINEAAVLACDAPISISQGATVGGGIHTNVGGSTVGSGAPAPVTSSAPVPPPAPPVVTPPPPPAPPAEMPPHEAAASIVNYYVTEVHETNYVDDRDTTNVNETTTNINAGDNAHIDVTNDNDVTNASGDGAVAVGEDAEVEGVATGDGAVAAGDDVNGAATGDGAVAAGEDIDAPVNTGENSGVISDDNDGVITGGDNSGIVANDSDIDDTILGDDNVQVSDSEQVAVGDGNVQAQDSTNTAGGDVNDSDVDVTDSDINNSNLGGQDNTATQDIEVDTDIDVDLEVEVEPTFATEVEPYEEPEYQEPEYEEPEYVSVAAEAAPVAEPADDGMDDLDGM